MINKEENWWKKKYKTLSDYLMKIPLATLSRLLPLMIAVGKYLATFLTAQRI
jgi:hypothetical protein